MYQLQQKIRTKERNGKMKYKLDKYELGCLIMCLNGSQFIEKDKIDVRGNCLVKVIDIYDSMTTKQKKVIDLTDKEYSLAIECLVLTRNQCIAHKQIKYVDEITNLIHKLNG